MSLLSDYSNQAKAYDATRGASESVLRPLRAALAGALGSRLADIGGGTGNYAMALKADGWEPTVIDRSPAMLRQAQAKGLPTIEADAQRLPLADASFDAAMLVSMLHHVERPHQALAEAKRILRPHGALAAMVFTWEDVKDSWCLDYFPSSRTWMRSTHLQLHELLAALPGAKLFQVSYADLDDGSMAALMAHPALVLERKWRTQTSFFERMERDHAAELHSGLKRLERALHTGDAPNEGGHASVIAWHKV